MTTCELCERRKPPVHSEMLRMRPGGALICLACDRLCCGKCKTILMSGHETRCPNCQCHVRKMNEP